MIACVAVKGSSLTEDISNDLLVIATEMASKGSEKMKLEKEDYEGLVTTSYERSSLGFFHGIRFKAEIESENGKSEVDFILRYQVTADITKDLYCMTVQPTKAKTAQFN